MNAPDAGRLIAVGVLGLVLAGCSPDPAPAPGPAPSSAGVSTIAPTLVPGGTAKPGSTTPATPLASVATTPVPPPTPGTVEQTVAPPTPVPTRKPVALDAPAQVRPGLSVRLTSVRALTGKARLPGETSGPAVALGLRVANTGSSRVGLGNVVVNVEGSGGTAGVVLTAPPAAVLARSVAAGRTVSGVYVFALPAAERSRVRVTVSLQPDQPVLVFTGRVG